jgi:hypothetical protein
VALEDLYRLIPRYKRLDDWREARVFATQTREWMKLLLDYLGALTVGGALVAASAAGFTTEAITLYVDGVSGNDNNAGTPAAPLRTVAEAEDRIPQTLLHHCKIVVAAAGTYSCPVFRPRMYAAGQLFVYGAPVTEVVSSIAAAASSSATVVKTSGATVDAYRGSFIEILTGPGAGDRRLIRNNTATDIVPVREFTAAITTSSTYRIVAPSVLLDVDTDYTADKPCRLHGASSNKFTSAEWHPTLSLGNVGFTGGAACSVVVDGEVNLFGVNDGGVAHIMCTQSGRTSLGTDRRTNAAAVAAVVAGVAASETAWSGYGYTSAIANGIGSNGTFANQVITGFVAASALACGIGFNILYGGNIYGTGGNLYGIVLGGVGVHCSISGRSTTLKVLINSASVIAAVQVARHARIDFANVDIQATGTGSSCILADNLGSAEVRSSTSVTGNGDLYACRARFGGRVYVTGVTALTATAGANIYAAGEGPTLGTGAGLAAIGNAVVDALGDGSVIQRNA